MSLKPNSIISSGYRMSVNGVKNEFIAMVYDRSFTHDQVTDLFTKMSKKVKDKFPTATRMSLKYIFQGDGDRKIYRSTQNVAVGDPIPPPMPNDDGSPGSDIANMVEPIIGLHIMFAIPVEEIKKLEKTLGIKISKIPQRFRIIRSKK